MKLRCLFAAVVLLAGCAGSSKQESQQDNSNAEGYPEIKFDTTVFDFKKILEGEQVTHNFKFVNIGDKDLIIEKIETSCGCTVPEYEKKPVAPGDSSVIKVRFDSSGKDGMQYKTVKITSNCKDKILELVVTGEVKHDL